VDSVNFTLNPSYHAVIFSQETTVCCDGRIHHAQDRSHEPLGAVELSSGLAPGGRHVITHVVNPYHVAGRYGPTLRIGVEVESVDPDPVGCQYGPSLGGGAIPRGDAEGQDRCFDAEVSQPCEPEVFECHDLGQRDFEEGLREGSAGGFHGLLEDTHSEDGPPVHDTPATGHH
jgi:hypothetical protein